MAINPETQYPGKIAPSTPDYPYGAARNITVPGDGTGTPWEAALVNDLFGFQQALLSEVGDAPSGNPEKVGASQYLSAITTLLRRIENRAVNGSIFPANGRDAEVGDTVPSGTTHLQVGGSLFSLSPTLTAPLEIADFGANGDDVGFVGGSRSTITGVTSLTSFIAGGDADNIQVDNLMEVNGAKYRVLMVENSNQGMTFNGKPLKVLDVYQTEQAQWTIVNGGDASKDQPKVPVYRSISRGMISEDVVYEFTYHSDGDFYEVAISHLFKHVFLQCGNGREITELQDAFGFVSQFDRGAHMDVEFMRSDAGTEFFPNKAQISIILPAGPNESTPVISNMSKPIRVGENNLNGIEVLNETRYETNLKYGACVVNYTGTLGSDDLAVFNIWKTDLGEVKGITWRYWGEFNTDNQAVIRYNRSEARFKDCAIDVENATFSGSPSAVVGAYFDRSVETFGCKFIGPAVSEDITAVSMYNTLFGGWEIAGRPENAFAVRGKCLLTSDIVLSGTIQNVFTAFGDAEVYLAGAGSSINGVNLYNLGSTPFKLHIDNSVTVVPGPWQYYKGKTVAVNTTNWTEDVSGPQIVAHHPSGGAASFGIAVNGVVTAKVGNVASVSGLEYSGDGTTRHMRTLSSGSVEAGNDNAYTFGTAGKRWSEIFAANGTINTSDERDKTEVKPLSAAEIEAAVLLSKEVGSYQWLASIEAKGEDDARHHIGLTVQRAIAVMDSCELEPMAYGFICYDVWPRLVEKMKVINEDGEEEVIETITEAGDRYGFRYSQLAMFILAGLNARMDKAGI